MPPGAGLAPEVVAFDEFMAAHGQWGGWVREDHEAFEAILKECGGDYAQVSSAVFFFGAPFETAFGAG
jgi:hypothetical protein